MPTDYDYFQLRIRDEGVEVDDGANPKSANVVTSFEPTGYFVYISEGLAKTTMDADLSGEQTFTMPGSDKKFYRWKHLRDKYPAPEDLYDVLEDMQEEADNSFENG